MATVRELVTSWGFDVDEKPLKKLDKDIASLKSTIKTVIATATAAGATLFGMAKFTANAGDEAVKVSQKLGIGVEKWQEYAHSANIANIAQESLAAGLGNLSRNMQEAADGSDEAAKAFRQMGIPITNAEGKLRSSSAVMEDVADRFKAMKDGTEKTVLAMKLFGKAGRDMIPLLNYGAQGLRDDAIEARRLGLVLSEETANGAELFNDNVTRMVGSLTGLRNLIGTALIPQFNQIILATTEWIVQNKEWIASGILQAVQLLTDNFSILLGLVAGLVAMKMAVVFISAAKAIWGVVVALQAAVASATALNLLMGGLPLLIGGLAAAGVVFAASGGFGSKPQAFGPTPGPDGLSRMLSGNSPGSFMGGGSITVAPTFNIQATGTNPQQLAQAIGEQTEPAIDRILREAKRDLKPASDR